MYDPDAIHQAVIAALDEMGWWHTERNGWRATRMQGRHCLYEVVFHPAEPHLLLAYALVPLRVPEASRPAIAEAITRANYGLLLGNFEMDFGDGELRFKVTLDLAGVALTTPMIADVLAASLAAATSTTRRSWRSSTAAAPSSRRSARSRCPCRSNIDDDTDDDDASDDDDDAIGPHAWPSLTSGDERGGTPIPITPRTSDAEIERAVAELIESMETTVTEEDDEPEHPTGRTPRRSPPRRSRARPSPSTSGRRAATAPTCAAACSAAPSGMPSALRSSS